MADFGCTQRGPAAMAGLGPSLGRPPSLGARRLAAPATDLRAVMAAGPPRLAQRGGPLAALAVPTQQPASLPIPVEYPQVPGRWETALLVVVIA